MTNKNKIMVLVALLGLALWSCLHIFTTKNCVDKYSFVNKRFACFEKHTIDKKDYRELRNQLLAYINERKEAGDVEVVSVFFRDLEAGPTLGIDERIDYAPASLLKLPVALVLMRLYEEGEIDIYKRNLLYGGGISNIEQAYKPENEIKKNIPYSVEELVQRSLSQSDNLADGVLLGYIEKIDNGRNLLLEIYRDLGILEIKDDLTSAVNTKGYSSIFQMLYNSSFLKPETSEELLNMMSLSSFKEGLKKGVPEEVRVAHKFGERVTTEGDSQLHDCGIIYYPTNPYLLCVMTRGRKVDKLQEIIAEISRRVYLEFDSRRIEE